MHLLYANSARRMEVLQAQASPLQNPTDQFVPSIEWVVQWCFSFYLLAGCILLVGAAVICETHIFLISSPYSLAFYHLSAQNQ